MSNELIPLSIPVDLRSENAQLRARVRMLEMALIMLARKATATDADQRWAQQTALRLGYAPDMWREIGSGNENSHK